MPEFRDPYDGKPYYCLVCGVGYPEFVACEDIGCTLESEKSAQDRQLRRRPMTTSMPEPQL